MGPTKTLLLLLLLGATAILAQEKAGQLPKDCGRFLSFKDFQGNLTDFDDYPWLVLLEYNTPTGRRAMCGGVLLSPLHVLTAAHCVSNLPANWNLSNVILGEYDTTSDLDCLPEGDADNSTNCSPEATRIDVTRVVPHEKYGTNGRAHNLALLKLAREATILETGYVWPICLPSGPAQRQQFHAAGWGRIAGRKPNKLKLRSWLSRANGTCRNWYLKEKVRLADDQFCAGGNEGEYPCFGDSGGPLMGVEKAEDGSIRMAVFGLLTVDSRFCDAPGWPAVYTDVLAYRDWILKNIN